MINFHDATKVETKQHNPNWPQIDDYSYAISIIGGSDLEKEIHYLT